LSLWATWTTSSGILNLELFFKDGTNTSLGAAPVYCDMPYTTDINMEKKITKVTQSQVKGMTMY